MADLTKEQQNEAYRQIRAMANAFRFCKDGEGLIVAVMQAEEQKTKLQAEIAQLREDLQRSVQETEAARAILAGVKSDLETEAERLAAYRETELAKIAQAGADEQARLEEQLRIAREAVMKAKQAHVAALQDAQAELAARNAEVQAAQEKLAGLKAELAAIAAKIGG